MTITSEAPDTASEAAQGTSRSWTPTPTSPTSTTCGRSGPRPSTRTRSSMSSGSTACANGSSRERSSARPAAAAPSTRPAPSTPSSSRWSSGTSRRPTWRPGTSTPASRSSTHGHPAPGALPQRPRSGRAGPGRGQGPGPAAPRRRDLQRLTGRDPEQDQQPPAAHADPARPGTSRGACARPSVSPNWASAA